ncbi:MAG: hypothetical protein Q7S73_01290 [bacterium]|nr:hypothetical protein [bacterium]
MLKESFKEGGQKENKAANLLKTLAMSFALAMGGIAETGFAKEPKVEKLQESVIKIETLVKKSPDKNGEKWLNGKSIGKAYEKTIGDFNLELEKRGLFIKVDLTKDDKPLTQFYFDEGGDGTLDALVSINREIKSIGQSENFKIDLTEKDFDVLQQRMELENINPSKTVLQYLFFDHNKKEATMINSQEDKVIKVSNPKILIEHAQQLYGTVLNEVLKESEKGK